MKKNSTSLFTAAATCAVSAVSPTSHRRATSLLATLLAPLLTTLLALSTLSLAAQDDPRLTAFNDLLTKGQRTADALTAEEMTKLLNEGRELGRPHPVSGVARVFLSRHAEIPPTVLRLAAQNAMLTGDYRLATARYKQFFRTAPVNADSSAAAAELFAILTDYTKQADEAFNANAEYGDKYRQSLLVKRYDLWFLDRCWDRRDNAALARRLVTIFKEKLPLEQERYLYWLHLDRLLERLAAVNNENSNAIIYARQLFPLIREDAGRAAQLKFFAENLAFHLAVAGKEAATLDRELLPVLAAAKEYLDIVPTDAALRQVMGALGGGPATPNAAIWAISTARKQEFFTNYAFAKLPAAEQTSFLGWKWWSGPRIFANAEQWVAIGTKFPQTFKQSPRAADLPWPTQTTNAALYKAQAAFLSGHAFDAAAVVSAVAAANEPAAATQHLLTQYAWYMPFNDRNRSNIETFPDLVVNQIIPAYAGIRGLKGPERDAFINEATLAFLEGPLLSSAVTPFAYNHIRLLLRNAWTYAAQDANRRNRYAAALEKLAWVQFNSGSREKVVELAQADFRRWATDTRRQFDSLTGKTDDASQKTRKELEGVVAQIAKLESAFTLAASDKVDPTRAPSPLCRDLVAVIAADNPAAFAAAVKPVYAAVREYQKSKTPFGEAIIEFLAAPRGAKLDADEPQLALFTDQLDLLLANPANADRGCAAIVRQLSARPGWRYDWTMRPAANDSEFRAKVATALANAISTLATKDQWNYTLFTWYRGVVVQTEEEAQKTISLIIDRDIFTKNKVALWHKGPTCSSLALIRNEFASLRGKYPLETWFDDRMAAEIKRDGWVEDAYWSYGHDRLKKVANATAALFSTDLSYNFVGTAAKPAPYTREQWSTLNWRALNADPEPAKAYLDKLTAAYGTARFDTTAAGAYEVRDTPAATLEGRKNFFAALAGYTAKAAKAPCFFDLPSMPQLNSLRVDGTSPLTDAELKVLLDAFRTCRWSSWTGSEERLMTLLSNGLAERNRYGELLQLAPLMWRIAHDQNRRETMLLLSGFTSGLMEKNQPIATATFSVSGLEIVASRLPEDIRNSLTALRTKSQAEAGGGLLVDRSDRRYPILAAQSLFHAGRLESAWEHYQQAPHLALSEYKDLDLAFSIWLVERRTTMGQFDQAEELSRTINQWIEAAPQGFDPETRAQMLIAYADIAFARQEYPRARAQYQRVAVAKEFAGTFGAKLADLKTAEVDRLTRHYDAAFERLDRLDRQRDTTIQAEARYQMALLRFDQEDYAGVRDAINRVFAIAPNHAQAGLLEGELNVRTKKLIEATELKIGLSADQQTLIPGRPLRVGLEDRTLAVVGKTTDIEIRVWTDSGDEEFFILLPFGDSKTKFRGEINTELAACRKGDHTLQVLGQDKVHYGFSDRFRKAAGVSVAEVVTVEVVTDSELYASSGRILTRQEQEEQAIEQMIRDRERITTQHSAPLSAIRTANEVKPGNPIYIRVIDPDRSTTPQKDKITVRASSSSGDVVQEFELEETEGYSGIFEGALPTASASATAFASDTEEGRQANYVIAADKDLPPWVGVGDKNRNKLFTVDLNNNVSLGSLLLVADVTGRTLKRFSLQTSMNGSDYTTVATWPETLPSWDGTLRIRMARYNGSINNLSSADAFRSYFSQGYITQGAPLAIAEGKVSADLRQTIRLAEKEIQIGQSGWAVAHLQGTFYVPERRQRTVRIDPKNRLNNVKYFVAINGKAGADPLEVTASLAKGYHTIDLYAAVHVNALAAYELLWDIPEDPYMIRIPATSFTAEAWDAENPPSGFTPARLVANEASTQFKVDFNPGASARLIRFAISDYESDAPAIRKIGLTNADGQKILPSPEDVMALRNNQILEIVPGDRITITYEDPSVINRDRQTTETFLSATFYNGEIGAYFVETMVDPRDNIRRPLFVPMHRYEPGAPVTVFVKDPDADETDDRDIITFTARATSGKAITVKAIETDKHSGIFVSRIFPVNGEPQRPTELTVASGDDIELIYRDEKNTDYGIPWDRRYVVERSVPTEPEIRVYTYESRLLTTNELAAIAARAPSAATGEVIPASRTLNAVRPATPHSDETPITLLGAPLLVELRSPALAISPLSTAQIFVQTSSARAAAGVAEDAPFNPSLPGTLRYTTGPTSMAVPKAPHGYDRISLVGSTAALNSVEDGRFAFAIPTALGTFDEADDSDDTHFGRDDDDRSLTISVHCLTDKGEPRNIQRRHRLPKLHLRPSDTIRVAVNTAGPKETPKWSTIDVNLTADISLDVMDQRYQKMVDSFHVGERMYLRVLDPLADTTSEKDRISLSLVVNGNKETAFSIELTETFEHTGIFKGNVQLIYEGVKVESLAPDTIAVPYGAAMELFYEPRPDVSTTHTIGVRKGADGAVLPFTKRFQDTDIAVQTQFTLAEAYFEMAKKHRALKEDEVARRGIAQGKKLLEEAIRDYPTTDARVQADYLLANLAFESAEQTENDDLRKKLFAESVTRFSDIIAGYPDSDYAPKSQFKKALVFERMGDIDLACEEYVKLSYRYPENELVAETIARLGQYFMTKGKEVEELIGAETDVVQKEKTRLQANEFYRTAAQVFSRLSQRFPEHTLAAKTKVLAAENWLRGQDINRAIAVYEEVISEKKATPDLIAQSMYWCGDSQLRQKNYVDSYRMFKRLTWDYPESVWAKYARARLTEPELARVELQEMKD